MAKIKINPYTRARAQELVDHLGALKAQIASLVATETLLKDALKERGAGAYVGEDYDATVSISERETLDMEAVRAKLSPQFIAAHTKVTTVAMVKVTARVRERVAA